MEISQIGINKVRNLIEVNFIPSPHCNLIFGKNASGKTSVLEAIHILSLARSFRTTHIKQVINHESDVLQVFAKITAENKSYLMPIGIERSAKDSKIRINSEPAGHVSELTSLLPVQIINPDVHKLLEQGPKLRRQFVDWGVFHVEQSFLQTWQQYYRVLRQRNAALRTKQKRQAVLLWDKQLIDLARLITEHRETYIACLAPLAQQYTKQLLQLDVEFKYQRGWNKENSLTSTLETGFEKDFQRGFTQAGPHRADLAILHNNIPVQTTFSRGQQKLLVCAMRLAQISHLQEETGQKSVVLVDDLAAELDDTHRKELLSLLLSTNAQCFITATEADSIPLPENIQLKMFHVEHGYLKEVVQ